jgi:hypothetical protein
MDTQDAAVKTIIENIETVENLNININIHVTIPAEVIAAVEAALSSSTDTIPAPTETTTQAETTPEATPAPVKAKRATGPCTGKNTKREWLFSAITAGMIKADRRGNIYRKKIYKRNGKIVREVWQLAKQTQQGKPVYDSSDKIIGHKGYMTVSVTYAGRSEQVYVAEIVWMTFNGLIPLGYTVDHIVPNKMNNWLRNLQLLTLSENASKGRKKAKK